MIPFTLPGYKARTTGRELHAPILKHHREKQRGLQFKAVPGVTESASSFWPCATFLALAVASSGTVAWVVATHESNSPVVSDAYPSPPSPPLSLPPPLPPPRPLPPNHTHSPPTTPPTPPPTPLPYSPPPGSPPKPPPSVPPAPEAPSISNQSSNTTQPSFPPSPASPPLPPSPSTPPLLSPALPASPTSPPPVALLFDECSSCTHACVGSSGTCGYLATSSCKNNESEGRCRAELAGFGVFDCYKLVGDDAQPCLEYASPPSEPPFPPRLPPTPPPPRSPPPSLPPTTPPPHAPPPTLPPPSDPLPSPPPPSHPPPLPPPSPPPPSPPVPLAPPPPIIPSITVLVDGYAGPDSDPNVTVHLEFNTTTTLHIGGRHRVDEGDVAYWVPEGSQCDDFSPVFPYGGVLGAFNDIVVALIHPGRNYLCLIQGGAIVAHPHVTAYVYVYSPPLPPPLSPPSPPPEQDIAVLVVPESQATPDPAAQITVFERAAPEIRIGGNNDLQPDVVIKFVPVSEQCTYEPAHTATLDLFRRFVYNFTTVGLFWMCAVYENTASRVHPNVQARVRSLSNTTTDSSSGGSNVSIAIGGIEGF